MMLSCTVSTIKQSFCTSHVWNDMKRLNNLRTEAIAFLWPQEGIGKVIWKQPGRFVPILFLLFLFYGVFDCQPCPLLIWLILLRVGTVAFNFACSMEHSICFVCSCQIYGQAAFWLGAKRNEIRVLFSGCLVLEAVTLTGIWNGFRHAMLMFRHKWMNMRGMASPKKRNGLFYDRYSISMAFSSPLLFVLVSLLFCACVAFDTRSDVWYSYPTWPVGFIPFLASSVVPRPASLGRQPSLTVLQFLIGGERPSLLSLPLVQICACVGVISLSSSHRSVLHKTSLSQCMIWLLIPQKWYKGRLFESCLQEGLVSTTWQHNVRFLRNLFLRR